MMKFFYHTMGLDDLRVNFIRPEGYAEGDADLTPRYKDVMGVLLKAIILNEQHFKKVFTFGGIPYCVMPPALRNNQELLRRYMGEYRDLSTSCSIRSDGGDLIVPGQKPDPNSWVQGPKALRSSSTKPTTAPASTGKTTRSMTSGTTMKPVSAMTLSPFARGYGRDTSRSVEPRTSTR